MPRDGSGVYRTPAGTDGAAGTVISSAAYNINVHDVETDLNGKRPVTAGGTGASTPAEALVNIGAETAYQVVTDFNTAVLAPGSFRAQTTAINGPVAGHAYAGMVYTTDAPPNPPTSAPPNNNLTIEARDQSDGLTPGKLWVRQKIAGVWRGWAEQTPGTGSDPTRVLKAGDTMSGDLTITKSQPRLTLNRIDGTSNQLVGQNNGVNRWLLRMGDTSGETGGNAGSDWFLSRFADDGNILTGGLKFTRKDGFLQIFNPGQAVILLDTTSNAGRSILGTRSSGKRWQLDVGNSNPETGGNAGSDFAITRYSDGDVAINTPYFIARNTGAHFFFGDVTTNAFLTVGTQAFKPGGGSFVDNSDARIKAVSGTYTEGLAAINHLTPKVFKYKANEVTAQSRPLQPGETPPPPGQPNPRSPHYAVRNSDFVGFIAQEVENYIPSMITQGPAEIDGTPVTDLRTLDMTNLIYMLVNACKELSARVVALEAKP